MDKFKPWFVNVQLGLMQVVKLGYDPASGPEQVLTSAAKAQNKPIIGLETAKQQIGYFNNLPETVQMQMLTDTIEQRDTVGNDFGRMVDDWAGGRPEALAKIMNDSLTGSLLLRATLLTDRNARWADWIEQRLKTPGTVFIAVGAGHLAGEKSVQSDLAVDGIQAKRVDY